MSSIRDTLLLGRDFIALRMSSFEKRLNENVRIVCKLPTFHIFDYGVP